MLGASVASLLLGLFALLLSARPEAGLSFEAARLGFFFCLGVAVLLFLKAIKRQPVRGAPGEGPGNS
ncbi:MAG: hypothetical protein NDJ90_10540 [Oligoflexia bacterium]|nr:hypothetical protein [Oligoflexia bacterium]